MIEVHVVCENRPLPTHQHRQPYAKSPTTYVEVPPSGSYVIRIVNRSPRRKLAVLSVDGLSVIDGKDASHQGQGYVLDPWTTVEVPGWRRGEGAVARFEFRPEEESYAAGMGRGTRNVGIIGVAVFEERVRQRPVDDHHWTWPWSWPVPPPSQPRRPWRTSPRWSKGDASVLRSASDGGVTALLDANVTGIANNSQSSTSVGTGYGQEAAFHTTSVPFERATVEPSELIELRYATRKQLIEWGVPLDGRPAEKRPSAFPASETACPPPPGWRAR